VRKLHEALAPYAKEDLEHTELAMPIAARLLTGQPLTDAHWAPSKRETATFVWRPALPNSLHPGDLVRVKQDAYEGSRAAVNGRVGTVAAIRGGIVIHYEGQRLGMGDRHTTDKLERQVPIRRSAEKGMTK